MVEKWRNGLSIHDFPTVKPPFVMSQCFVWSPEGTQSCWIMISCSDVIVIFPDANIPHTSLPWLSSPQHTAWLPQFQNRTQNITISEYISHWIFHEYSTFIPIPFCCLNHHLYNGYNPIVFSISNIVGFCSCCSLYTPHISLTCSAYISHMVPIYIRLLILVSPLSLNHH